MTASWIRTLPLAASLPLTTRSYDWARTRPGSESRYGTSSFNRVAERMVFGVPAFFLFVVRHEREVEDPGGLQVAGIEQLQFLAQAAAERGQRRRRDRFFRVGHEEQQVARLALEAANDLALLFLGEELGDRRIERPSFTRKKASPFAPYWPTKAVSSSIVLRLYFSAAPLAFSPRTRPAGVATADLKALKLHLAARSLMSTSSIP